MTFAYSSTLLNLCYTHNRRHAVYTLLVLFCVTLTHGLTEPIEVQGCVIYKARSFDDNSLAKYLDFCRYDSSHYFAQVTLFTAQRSRS